MNPKVDFYFNKAKKWQPEIEQMRVIAIDAGLQEELKWGCPCYTSQGSNIVLIHTFKEYCAFLFFKGALMKDTGNLLIQQTENVQSARQLRFTSLAEIKKLQKTIRAYISEAIDIEKAGLKVPMKKTTEFAAPEEWTEVLQHDAGLKEAFSALTPGRQRAYLLHFSAPKQAKTREARIAKAIPDILQGKGLTD